MQRLSAIVSRLCILKSVDLSPSFRSFRASYRLVESSRSFIPEIRASAIAKTGLGSLAKTMLMNTGFDHLTLEKHGVALFRGAVLPHLNDLEAILGSGPIDVSGAI